MEDRKGLYKRGDTWWVRIRSNGTHIRRSAKTSDLFKARIFRDDLKAALWRTTVSDDWASHVADHVADSQSWLHSTVARAKRRSEKHGWEYPVSASELAEIMLRSKGQCEVTGLSFERRVRRSGG